MSKTYSAGIATAYGAAVRGGYTGSYDDFCNSLGDLADVLNEFENFSVEVTTLPAEASATASYNDGVLSLGIPKGPGPTDAQVVSAVDDWLTDHPEATTTVDFSIATKVFNTVSAMQEDLTLKVNDNVCTKGYYASGDNGGANYVVSDTHSGVFYITLDNGLYANMLSESSVLPAEAVGIKAYTSTTDNPDNDDMDKNVAQFQAAIDAGILLLFGKGHFYFSAPVELRRSGTYKISGLHRDLSRLHFPSSDGLVFSQTMYYNYWFIENIAVISYGISIKVAENIANIMDSYFNHLHLESETSDAFRAPTYNVSKFYYGGGDHLVYDTALQNCTFFDVNVKAPVGAGFANIMGLGNRWIHINFVQTYYCLRNCDGRIEHINTLGGGHLHFIYYDQAYSHSLKLHLENVNAEGIHGALIYTEPEVALQPGEDSKKPTTANIMTISHLYAIDSGMSLSGDIESGHTYYPITVHQINRIELFNATSVVKPNAYPDRYDTDTVKANIWARRSRGMTHYVGDPDITERVASVSYVYTYYGKKDRTPLTNAEGHGENGTLVPAYVNTFKANKLYGGKAMQYYTADSVNGIMTVPDEYNFADCVVVKTTDASKKTLSWLKFNKLETYPGRLLAIVNAKTSTETLALTVSANTNMAFSESINLLPARGCLLVLAFDAENRYLVWKKVMDL